MDILDKGFYRARAVEHQFGVAETGTEQVAVTFEIRTEGRWKEYRITWFGYFTEGTVRRTLESLRTCGWEGDDVTDLVGLDRNEVELEVVHEAYNGELRAKVKWVNRVSGVFRVKNPMTVEQKRALSARVRHLALAMRAPAGAAPAPFPSAAARAPNGRGATGGAAPGGYPGL